MAEYSNESGAGNSGEKRSNNRGGYKGGQKSYGGRGGNRGQGGKGGYRKYGDRDGKPGSRSNDGRKSYGDRKPYGDRDHKPSGDRDGKPYRKYDGEGQSDGRSGKPYRSNNSKPYGKRDGGKPYGDRDRKPYGKRDGGKPYGNRDGKSYGDRKPYGKLDNRKPYEDKNGKPYRKYDGEGTSDRPQDGEHAPSRENAPRTYGSRKPYNKGGRGSSRPSDRKPYGRRYDRDDRPQRDFDESDELKLVGIGDGKGLAADDANIDGRDERRDFGRRDSRGRGPRGKRGPRYDTKTPRDLVKIATTDNSADFIYAGGGLRHTDSEFYVDPGDPIVSEAYGNGLVSKVMSGKVQVEFEDGKRWFAHPMAMQKGVILKPGMEKPEPQHDERPYDDVDDEVAALLVTDEAAFDVSVNAEEENEPSEGDLQSLEAAEQVDDSFDDEVESLLSEVSANEDAASFDPFSDEALLSGDDLAELDAIAGEAD